MIASLRLQNFRSYQDDSYEFSPGVTIIVGPNASGKTNLLEAILVLCQGGSYRAKDGELIAHDAPWARLEAHVDEQERIITIEHTGAQKSTKKYKINKQVLSRLPLAKTLPVVLFEPEHLQLLHAGPEKRRDFLDEIIEKSTPGYGQIRRNYRRALAQRNRLLKRLQAPHESELFAWNVRLSELGGQIVEARQQIIDRCNLDISRLYQSISTSTLAVKLNYLSSLNREHYSSHMLQKLEADYVKDRERGFTSSGPHRDDFVALINDRDARISASRGEARTLLLSLKLLELQILEQTRSERPILLLDDVFSELDGARRKALTSFLKEYQTFITTTDADIVVQHFMGACTIIPTKK